MSERYREERFKNKSQGNNQCLIWPTQASDFIGVDEPQICSLILPTISLLFRAHSTSPPSDLTKSIQADFV